MTEDGDLAAFGCLRSCSSSTGAPTSASSTAATPSPPSATAAAAAAARAPAREPPPLFPEWADWDSGRFLDLCILAGCDYLDHLPHLAIATAHRLLRAKGDAEKAVRTHAMERPQPPGKVDEYLRKFRRAREAFLHQRVYDPTLKRIVPLTPPPAAAKPMPHCGEDLADDLAVAICERAELHPGTREPYAQYIPPPPASSPDSARPSAAAVAAAAARRRTAGARLRRRRRPTGRRRRRGRRRRAAEARVRIADERLAHRARRRTRRRRASGGGAPPPAARGGGALRRRRWRRGGAAAAAAATQGFLRRSASAAGWPFTSRGPPAPAPRCRCGRRRLCILLTAAPAAPVAAPSAPVAAPSAAAEADAEAEAEPEAAAAEEPAAAAEALLDSFALDRRKTPAAVARAKRARR